MFFIFCCLENSDYNVIQDCIPLTWLLTCILKVMAQTLTAPNVMVCYCSCALQGERTPHVLIMLFPPPT